MPELLREASRFRYTLTRVLIIQLVTLFLLWLMQHRYAA
jgi:hypothetical protein